MKIFSYFCFFKEMKATVLLTLLFASLSQSVQSGQVPVQCFSIAKLFPPGQTLMPSGLIISDLNLLLGDKFNEHMRLSAVSFCRDKIDQ